jgi:hypothetical protein
MLKLTPLSTTASDPTITRSTRSITYATALSRTTDTSLGRGSLALLLGLVSLISFGQIRRKHIHLVRTRNIDFDPLVLLVRLQQCFHYCSRVAMCEDLIVSKFPRKVYATARLVKRKQLRLLGSTYRPHLSASI